MRQSTFGFKAAGLVSARGRRVLLHVLQLYAAMHKIAEGAGRCRCFPLPCSNRPLSLSQSTRASGVNPHILAFPSPLLQRTDGLYLTSKVVKPEGSATGKNPDQNNPHHQIKLEETMVTTAAWQRHRVASLPESQPTQSGFTKTLAL